MARVIAVAYPQHEADRVRFSQQGTRSLPRLAVEGAYVLRCDRCAIDLNVGPKVQAKIQRLWSAALLGSPTPPSELSRCERHSRPAMDR